MDADVGGKYTYVCLGIGNVVNCVSLRVRRSLVFSQHAGGRDPWTPGHAEREELAGVISPWRNTVVREAVHH